MAKKKFSFKKVLLNVTALATVAALSVAGTVAYLTDTDSDVNVMTLGNVSIAQHEYERVVENGEYKTDTIANQTSYVLQEFTQAKPLLPIVGDPSEPSDSAAYAGWDDIIVHMTQVDSYGSMQVFAGKNAQDKFVTVENTGKTDAYIRTIVAIEVGSANPSLISFGNHFTWVDNKIGVATIDGNNYYLHEFAYVGWQDGNRHVGGILPAGDTSYPSLSQVYIKHEATNDDMVKLDGNQNGALDILVVSQAVQAAGFADAQTALDTAFGDITVDNNPWVTTDADGNRTEKAPAIPAVVSNADELIAALEDGKDVVLTNDVKIDPAGMSNAYGTTGINIKNGQSINGNGNTLDIKGAGGTWDSGINTTGGLIENITVTGSFRGIFINHNSDHSEPVILKNVTIDGTTYTISCDQGLYQNLEATDSTFNGWTSFAKTLGSATFTNCSFGEGNGYAYMRPYAPTTFVGCDFEAGYEMDAEAAVTFEDCTIGGVPLTADNLATLVTFNIANASVK